MSDGRCTSLLKSMACADLLVLDDLGLKAFNPEQQQHDPLEILEDRHGLRSTLITSHRNQRPRS
jgi:DNA replication protein DnaC